MSLAIDNIIKASPEEWDSIWKGCGYSTYFHSREWAEIWETYTHGHIIPGPLVVVFSDGMRALLPLSINYGPDGGIVEYVSSPAGTFGGWLSMDSLCRDHVVLLADYLRGMVPLRWRLNPYDGNVTGLNIEGAEEDLTYAVDLTGGLEGILRRWSRTRRAAVSKARRSGVTVKVASSHEEWMAYYEVYEDTLGRWGAKATSRYGHGIFDEMYRRNSWNIRLWLAMFEGKVVAGDLVLYAAGHAVDWHASVLGEFLRLEPTGLIMYEAIRDACERGLGWFDLNPSGGHKGATAYKKRCGAVPLRCPVLRPAARDGGLMGVCRRLIGRMSSTDEYSGGNTNG